MDAFSEGKDFVEISCELRVQKRNAEEYTIMYSPREKTLITITYHNLALASNCTF